MGGPTFMPRKKMIKVKLSVATGLDSIRFAFGERTIVISKSVSLVAEEDVKALETQFPNWTERVITAKTVASTPVE